MRSQKEIITSLEQYFNEQYPSDTFMKMSTSDYKSLVATLRKRLQQLSREEFDTLIGDYLSDDSRSGLWTVLQEWTDVRDVYLSNAMIDITKDIIFVFMNYAVQYGGTDEKRLANELTKEYVIRGEYTCGTMHKVYLWFISDVFKIAMTLYKDYRRFSQDELDQILERVRSKEGFKWILDTFGKYCLEIQINALPRIMKSCSSPVSSMMHSTFGSLYKDGDPSKGVKTLDEIQSTSLDEDAIDNLKDTLDKMLDEILDDAPKHEPGIKNSITIYSHTDVLLCEYFSKIEFNIIRVTPDERKWLETKFKVVDKYNGIVSSILLENDDNLLDNLGYIKSALRGRGEIGFTCKGCVYNQLVELDKNKTLRLIRYINLD